MVAGLGVDANPEQTTSAGTEVIEGVVASWNGKHEWLCDSVEAAVGDTQPPDELIDVGNMLLMGFWSKDDNGTPTALMTLSDPAVGEKSVDLLHNDSRFVNAVSILAARDWRASARIDVKLPTDDRPIDPFLNEGIPVRSDDGCEGSMETRVQISRDGDDSVKFSLVEGGIPGDDVGTSVGVNVLGTT
jgi:hypothetical protein